MYREIESVMAFHSAMGLTVNTNITAPSPEDIELRKQLILEEVKETVEHLVPEGNIEELAKEIADLLVVVFGTVVTYGLQGVIGKVFNEIMRANMSKLDDDGKAIINGQNGVLDESRALGKVLKGPNYKPADVSHIFRGLYMDDKVKLLRMHTGASFKHCRAAVEAKDTLTEQMEWLSNKQML